MCTEHCHIAEFTTCNSGAGHGRLLRPREDGDADVAVGEGALPRSTLALLLQSVRQGEPAILSACTDMRRTFPAYRPAFDMPAALQ